MSAEALDRIALATGRRKAPDPALWQGSQPAATVPQQPTDPDPPKPRAKSAEPANAEPAKARPANAEPTPPKPPPEPERVEEERVVTKALKGATPVRGTPAVTTSRHATLSRTGGRAGGKSGTLGRKSGALGRSTGTMRRSGTMDGARKTSAGGAGRKGKKQKSSGIMGLLVALVLFAVVTVVFVVLLKDKEISQDPPPEAPPTSILRLSDRLEIEPWDHPTAVELGEVLQRFNGLVAAGLPLDVERVGAIEAVAQEFAASCDSEFLACAAASRASFAAYRGCRTITGCDADRSRSRFRESVEQSDRSLKAVTSLEPEYRTDALKRVTVQAVRLAGQSMKGLRGMAPDLATLAEQACRGSLKSMPDCDDAMKP